jgi:RNA polymerase sigma factor (sigma-70 family)
LTAADEGKIDPAIVARLYVEYGDELKRFLLGVLRDSQLASDVMQVAFTKLIERGHETRDESRKAWLFRVAYNEAMAIRRREAVGDKVVRRMAWTRDASAGAADVPLVRLEEVESVRAALDELPAEQQQIVRMRIYEEKTFAVIAKELDIPLGTALGRMRTALAKLKKKLKEHNEH